MKFVRTSQYFLTHHLKQFWISLIYYKNIVQYFYNSQLDKKNCSNWDNKFSKAFKSKSKSKLPASILKNLKYHW